MKNLFIITVLMLIFIDCASQKPLWEAIHTNENKIVQIENRLEAIKEDISGIKALIERTKQESQAKISSNEGTIRLLQEDIKRLNTLIENIKIENMGQLEDKLKRIDKAVDLLRDRERVSRLENETN